MKKILIGAGMFVLGFTPNAWAGKVAEIPSGFAPFFMAGLLGVVLATRYFLKR